MAIELTGYSICNCMIHDLYILCFQGHYVYAEASQVNRGQVAKLQSEDFPAAPKGRCIEFAYSMYGSGIGALNVYLIDSKTGKKSKIFSKSGDQGPGWHRTNANFVSNNEYKVGRWNLLFPNSQ